MRPFQSLIAGSLVLVGIALVLLWFLLAAMAITPDGRLEPWNAAGVLLLGLPWMVGAAVVTVPGIIWRRAIAVEAAATWERPAVLPGRIPTIVLVTGFAAALVAFIWGIASSSQDESFAADLALSATCESPFPEASEKKIESFLSQSGFRTVNFAKEWRSRNEAPAGTLSFEALDERQRSISFDNRGRAESLGVALYTLPPTVHNAEYEDELISFVQDQLHCIVSSINRAENGEKARAGYLKHTKRIEDFLNEPVSPKKG
jgi:hypothetical protein